MNSKDDSVFLEHILDSINAIEDFSKGLTKENLVSNRLKRSAIVREIEIVGEAVKNISESLGESHQEVEWKDIVGARDKMIHHYFGVDLDVVFGIINQDLPVLKKQIVKIKNSLEEK